MSSQRKSGASLATYGKLDTTDASKQLWLARLPPKLARLWDEAPEGTLLGHLTFTKGTPLPRQASANPNTNNNNTNSNSNKSIPISQYTQPATKKMKQQMIPQKLAIHTSKELAKDQPELPLDYTLTNLTTKIPTMHPYTRQTNGSVTVHGKISRSCNLQMERTMRYRQTCKTRLLAQVAGRDKRHVKPVQSADLSMNVSATNLGSGFGSTIANFGKKMMDAQKDLQNSALTQNRKRKFDESQSVRSILFELFSQQQYWSVKELRAASGGRAEKEIRAELSQIAEFKRTGEFKGQWELKKDFASSSKDGNGAQGGTG